MMEKILVVDDEPRILDLVSSFLTGWGYSVSLAQSAAQAKEFLATEEYALLLTDIVMPDESGLELAQFVKLNYPSVVVIFISVLEDRDTAKVAIDTGVYAYLSKPIRYYELMLAVQNGLYHRRLTLENAQHMEQLEEKVRQRTQEPLTTIDELQEIRQEYKDSEEKFKLLSENCNDGILIHHKGKILYLNVKMVEIIGGERTEDFIGNDIKLYVHADDLQQVLEINDRRLKGLPVPDRYELKGVRLDGQEVDLEVSATLAKYQGLPVSLGTFRDITRQKADRKAIEESEERLQTILTAVQAGILVIDKQSLVITMANPAALDMIGVAEEEIIGRAHCDFAFSGEEDRCRLMDDRDEIQKWESVILTGDGKEIQVLKTVVPFTVHDREYILESFVDISALKQIEADLAQAYTDLDNLLSSISSVLIQISPSGRIRKWNRQAEQLFDLRESEVLNRFLYDLPLSWNHTDLHHGIAKCREEHAPIQGLIIDYQKPERGKGFLGFSIFPHFDEQGIFSGLLLLGNDMTEWKNLESQLLQAQKMESIGQLAAGIAHEINTPIQYVGDNTRFLHDAFADVLPILEKCSLLVSRFRAAEDITSIVPDVERILEECDAEFLKDEVPLAIEQTLQGVEQVAAIVRSMKDFSHPGEKEKALVNINKALRSTATISRNEWKYVAELEMDLADELPMVPCLAGEMNQVFLNIIVNAAQAIAEVVGDQDKGKGTITINTQSDEHGVEIRIADTGKGIPENDRPYIFDPFFTTKEVGEGTGQGLALAYSTVVDKHGGSLRFESKEGLGTTFIIRLPFHTGEI